MALRFAAHLGVRAPDRPLFRKLAGSADPLAQLAFIAGQGFAGASDNFGLLRGEDEQRAIGAEAARLGLEIGSVVHDPLAWNAPTWTQTGATARQGIAERLAASLAGAGRLGSRTLNCVTGHDPQRPRAVQLEAMADNLGFAGDLAARAGVILCIEATHPAFAPGALVESLDDALLVAERAAQPAVRLNFDVGHLALHGLDVVEAIGRSARLIGMVQVADVPGRVEPGAGVLPWPAIFQALEASGYEGLVELELEPALPGAEGETALLRRLRALAPLSPA
jgi:sugar phosphate isomerase/epimerase